MFGQRPEASVVEELLSYSEDLERAYDIYQSLSECIKDRDFKKFKDILLHIRPNVLPNQMKTSINTLKKHLPLLKK